MELSEVLTHFERILDKEPPTLRMVLPTSVRMPLGANFLRPDFKYTISAVPYMDNVTTGPLAIDDIRSLNELIHRARVNGYSDILVRKLLLKRKKVCMIVTPYFTSLSLPMDVGPYKALLDKALQTDTTQYYGHIRYNESSLIPILTDIGYMKNDEMHWIPLGRHRFHIRDNNTAYNFGTLCKLNPGKVVIPGSAEI